ncbi:MAG: hypothetical protein ACXWM7_06750 [Parachlamydiaceae bacterium]
MKWWQVLIVTFAVMGVVTVLRLVKTGWNWARSGRRWQLFENQIKSARDRVREFWINQVCHPYQRIQRWYKENKIADHLRKWANRFFVMLFYAGLIYMIVDDWDGISKQNYSNVRSMSDFWPLLLTRANIHVALIAGAYLLMSIALLIFRFPLQRFEQLKMFGVEYKLQAEKIEEKATEKIEKQDAYHRICFSVISQLQKDDDFYNDIQECVTKDTTGEVKFEMKDGLFLALEAWTSTLRQNTPSFTIDYDILTVTNNKLVEEEIEMIDPKLALSARKAMRYERENFYSENGTSYIAVPVKRGFPDDNYVLVCLHTQDVLLTESDAVLIDTFVTTVKTMAELAQYDEDTFSSLGTA